MIMSGARGLSLYVMIMSGARGLWDDFVWCKGFI